jgi:hypothetical protein
VSTSLETKRAARRPAPATCLLFDRPHPVGSVASVVLGALFTAICSGLPVPRGPAILSRMGTKSRETIYGASIRAAAERATERARLPIGSPSKRGTSACLAFRVRRSRRRRWATRSMRRPKTTPVHELERYMRCKDCSKVRGYPFKRSHLVALRSTKITAADPPSTWWPGER